jgi:hypothetical protein
VWENWAASHCDPARSPSPGWWYEQDRKSLGDPLHRMIGAAADPDTLFRLRLQMVLAIMATSSEGFVEQRIMSGAAGLEHIMWQTFVLGGRMTKEQFDGHTEYQGETLAGHDRLRMALKDAQIPIDIDPSLLPVPPWLPEDDSDEAEEAYDQAWKPHDDVQNRAAACNNARTRARSRGRAAQPGNSNLASALRRKFLPELSERAASGAR